MTTYCSGSYVKRRLYIGDEDNTFNTALTGSILEAEAYIDSVLRQYQTVPITAPAAEIQYACADFAASIFRNDQLRKKSMQGTFDLDVMATDSFWAAGEQKLKNYVEARYLASGSSYKSYSVPDIKSLVELKVISLVEARNLLGGITTGSVASHTSIDPTSILELNRQGILSVAESRTLLNTILSGSTETQARINLLAMQRNKLTGSDAGLINAEINKIWTDINILTGSGLSYMYGQLTKLTGSDTTLQTAETSRIYAEANRLTGSGTTELYGRLNKLTGSDIALQTAEINKINAEMNILTGSGLLFTSGSTVAGIVITGTATGYKTTSAAEIGETYQNGLISLAEGRSILTNVIKTGSLLLARTGSDI